MQYGQMLNELQHRAPMERERAEVVMAATVQAMSEVARDEMADLRSQLPFDLKHITPAKPDPERSLDEFAVRVGDLAQVAATAEAREYAYAAFRVLAESVTPGQLRQLLENLPHEYAELAPSLTGLTGDGETLLANVRTRTSAENLERARELTEVVLGVLAEHISTGQAGDLAARLPEDFRTALATDTHSRHTDNKRFFIEIDRRTGTTDSDRSKRDVAGVLAAVGQWAPSELEQSLAQAPQEVAELAR